MCTYSNNSDNYNGEDRKGFFNTINFKNKQWALKSPNSLKKELELGLVLKLEIGETSIVAPSFFDFFVSLSSLRFESQSDVIPAGSL